jgi:hypothetical protein
MPKDTSNKIHPPIITTNGIVLFEIEIFIFKKYILNTLERK